MRRTPRIRVLPSTWAFKCRRRPDSNTTKFKASVVYGDHQLEGVGCFQTWAPICHWSIICTMMILTAKGNLYSAQCNTTDVFLHAKIPDDEHIYTHQPQGFKDNCDYVIRLNCSLYRLNQSPRYFFWYLSMRLEKQVLVYLYMILVSF